MHGALEQYADEKGYTLCYQASRETTNEGVLATDVTSPALCKVAGSKCAHFNFTYYPGDGTYCELLLIVMCILVC